MGRLDSSPVRILFTPLAGRMVAMVGEVVFMCFGLLPVLCWGPFKKMKLRVTCGLICLAECVSNTGVIKRHYGFFLVENSIWTIVFFFALTQIFKKRFFGVQYDEAKGGVPTKLHMLVITRFVALIAIALFVGYELYFDLPMYYNLWQDTVAKGHQDGYNLRFWPEGVNHSLKCHMVVDSASNEWRPIMLWQAANYTAVPLVMILLSYLTIDKKLAMVCWDQRTFGADDLRAGVVTCHGTTTSTKAKSS